METKKIDYFEDVLFHPSLDIKKEILVLGFRIKPEVKSEEELFLIISKNSIQMTSESHFTIDDSTYQIDLKSRKLSKLSKRWSLEELQNVYEHLSKEWKPLANGLDVFNKLKSTLKDHLDLEDSDCTLLVIWALGTYFFPIFSAYPYLHIKAPKGSGKSQCLSFLNEVCFNATKARASLPALRDTVDALRGTYLMDQADALYRNNMEDFLDILTDSYKRGGGEVRKMISDKGKNWNLAEFQAYSPKAFASIYQLPEDLRDRCLLIALTRSRKNFKPLDEEDAIWKTLRGDIYKLLIERFSDVSCLYDILKAKYRIDSEILGRQLELWLPLEVLMSAIGVPDEEKERAKERFKSKYAFTEAQTTDLEKCVIETILDLMDDKLEITLSPKEIAEQIDDSIFEEIDEFITLTKKTVRVGKTINKFNLSHQKLTRNSHGERYLFKREQVEKVSTGYITSETTDEPTSPYIQNEDLTLM